MNITEEFDNIGKDVPGIGGKPLKIYFAKCWNKPLTPEEAFEHHTRLRKDFSGPEKELQRKLNNTPSGALKSLSLKFNLNKVLKIFGIDK